MVLALVLGLVVTVQFAGARRFQQARADVSTGTAGLFVPTQGNVMDTRSGAGGVTGPVTANTWYPLQIEGQVGVPASGVSSVQVSVTVLSPTTGGVVTMAPDGASTTSVASMTYGAGGGSISSSSIVAMAADGKIEVRAQTSVTMLVDVQGYYTAGNGDPAPGGYVPITPTRIVDTRYGTGLPKAKLVAGSTTAVQVGGVAGVPSDASAVFALLTAVSSGSVEGFMSPYPTGTTRPADVSLNYSANTATIIGAAVDLGTGGQFNLWVGGGSPIDFVLSIVGYYTAAPGTKGAFTPAAARAYDSRKAPNTVIAANTSTRVQIGGVAGIPLPGSGISAYAVSAQVIHSGSNAGELAIAPGDQRTASVATVYFPTGSTVRSDLSIVPTAGDGTVLLVNGSPDPINVVLDVEGWYSAVGAAIPSGQSRTQENVTLQADPSGGGSWVTYQYRVGITGTWTNVPTGDVTVPGTTTHPSSWPVQKSGTPAVFAPYTWDAGSTLSHGDQLFQIQACFGVSAGDPSPGCSMASSVQLATRSFGDSYATESIGPGSVSLLTGDYQLSASDVSVPSYLGSLSIGRSFTTLAPAGERADASGIFGPGWSASLPGADVGSADQSVSTSKLSSGYLSFTDATGAVSIYQATSPTSSYPISFSGTGDVAADGSTVSMPSASEVDLLDTDGTKTVWTLAGGVWGASSVTEVGSASTTSYTRDSAGRVTRILGAIPPGVTCAIPDTTPGCRSLTLAYTTLTIGGSTVTRLQSATFHAYDPVAAAMASVVVASYDYDGSGRLADEYDPRISPNLKTAYTYDTNGRLATETDPGLAPWTLGYNGSGQLSTASRYDSALAQSAVSTVVYSSSMQYSPIDLSAATAATWGQTADHPVQYAAVFGPNHQPASTNPASVTSTDWPYATVHYLDANGRETNTASYGAGAWQYSDTIYDANGNTVSMLTPGNRAQALITTADTDPAVVAATGSTTRAGLLSTITQHDPLNPNRVIDSYGPTHPIVLNDGSAIDGRTHKHTGYDEGAPLDGSGNPQVFDLPTSVRTSAWDVAAATDDDVVLTKSGYAGLSTTSGSAITGWDLRQATSTTEVGAGVGATDLVTNTRYNDSGQTTQSWLPASSGSDARSTSTTYYTPAGTGSCVSAAFAGLICSTGPTTQPSSGNPLPVSTTAYNLYGQAHTVTETAGATVRTTTTSYDTAGRVTGTAVAVVPAAAGGVALPAVSDGYNSNTGLLTTVSAGGMSLTETYDTFGRVATYTDTTGNVSTFAYDVAGRVATVNDGKGSTNYTYESTTEHRGMATAENFGLGAAPSALSASYDSNGNLATQTYPNGLAATTRYDNADNSTVLSYVKSGATWLSFTRSVNAQDLTAAETSPTSAQSFGYDNAGRLVRTKDSAGSSCITRTYALDGDSNRTLSSAYPSGTGGVCSTTGTPTTTTSIYDGADRLNNSGYSYDTLGRTVTVPSGDAAGAGSHAGTTGSLSIGYYVNDLVASEMQGARTLGFALDPLQDRILTTTDSGGATKTRHFADATDLPTWQSVGSSGWVRYLYGIGGSLIGSLDQDGTATLDLENLHGDAVATVADDVSATSPSGYSEVTEFGAPRSAATAPDTYGWLANDQRSSDTLGGLTMMGFRLYNSATGRFLTVDPVAGGSDNPYDYCSGNPIDCSDPLGLWIKQYSKIFLIGKSSNHSAKHAATGVQRLYSSMQNWAAHELWLPHMLANIALFVVHALDLAARGIEWWAERGYGVAVEVTITIGATHWWSIPRAHIYVDYWLVY